MVTQLANATEKGALTRGDQVCLVVESSGKEGAAAVKLNITRTTPSTPYPDSDNLPFF